MNLHAATVSDVRPRWQVASALGLTQIFSFGSSYYLHGVLGATMRAEMGFSLAYLSGAQSAGMLVAGLVSPAVGRAIGRSGGRAPLSFGFLMLALGLVIIASSLNPVMFVAGWLVLGVGMGAAFYDGVFASLGKLYGHGARGPITTVTLWGGFASTVCWPLSAVLVDHIGWRGVCLVFAAIHLAICIPLVRWSLPSNTLQEAAISPQPTYSIRPPSGAAFYLLMAASVTTALSMTVLLVHLIAMLEARGFALAVAVSLGTLIGPSQVGARAIDMSIGARHHPMWTLMAALVLMAVGTVLLAAKFSIIGVSIMLFAAGNGIYSIARGAVPLALFGPQAYPAAMGRLARPQFIGQALAPTIGALMITRLGVDVTLWTVAGLCVANVLTGAALFFLVMRRG